MLLLLATMYGGVHVTDRTAAQDSHQSIEQHLGALSLASDTMIKAYNAELEKRGVRSRKHGISDDIGSTSSAE